MLEIICDFFGLYVGIFYSFFFQIFRFALKKKKREFSSIKFQNINIYIKKNYILNNI